MTRTSEIRKAVALAVNSYGGRVVFSFAGNGHLVAHIFVRQGSRRVHISASPSDRNAVFQVLRDVRHTIRTLEARP